MVAYGSSGNGLGISFFGLVLASTWFVGKDIKEWNKKTIPAFIIGVAVAYYITVATPAETPSNLVFHFPLRCDCYLRNDLAGHIG
mgnify:CR=1 FL=1